MSRVLFEIEDGVLAFAPVDKAAVGYTDDWLAPTGKTVDTALLADYDPSSGAWSCQCTAGGLTPTADTTTRDIPATFCDDGETLPNPKKSTWTLDVELLQDPIISTTLFAFLVEHDPDEVYFMLGLNGADPPKAIGRVRATPSAFGGPARNTLTATLSMSVSGTPSFEVGDATTSVIVPAPATTLAAEPAAADAEAADAEPVTAGV